MELKPLVSPDRYELSGDDTQITYRTAGSGGEAELAYSGRGGEHTFSRDGIAVQARRSAPR